VDTGLFKVGILELVVLAITLLNKSDPR
jgi:hypothetical protein